MGRKIIKTFNILVDKTAIFVALLNFILLAVLNLFFCWKWIPRISQTKTSLRKLVSNYVKLINCHVVIVLVCVKQLFRWTVFLKKNCSDFTDFWENQTKNYTFTDKNRYGFQYKFHQITRNPRNLSSKLNILFRPKKIYIWKYELRLWS